MVLKWIGASRDTDDVSELIARKKYGRAIEVLRAQFKQRPPGVQTRLQFVDVLILAGRGREAVPILVGLAEELAADGFSSKAIALLKRVEKIEPGRPDVESLLGQLVMDRPPRESSSVPSLSARARESPEPAFGLEEIDDDAPEIVTGEASVVEAADETETTETRAEAPPEPPAEHAEAETGEAKSQIRGAFRKFLEGLDEESATPAAPEAAETAGEAPAATPEPESAPAAEAPAEVEPEPERRPEKRRRGGFLRRLFGGDEEEREAQLEARPEQAAAEPDAAEPAITTAEVEAVAELRAPAEVETALAGEEPPAAEQELAREAVAAHPPTTAEIEAVAELRAPEVEPEPVATELVEPEPVEPEPVATGPVEPEPVEPEAAPGPEVEAEAAAKPERRADTPEPEAYLRQLLATPADASLDEAGFQDQVLDLIEEVLQQPVPAAEPAPAPAAQAEQEPAAAREAPKAPVRTRGVAESAQQLAANPLLRELSEEERLAVVRGMRLHTYEAGDVVATEGEPGDSLFTVILGGLRVFVKNPAGHNFEMGLLGEGEFFGEISSISGRPRTSTVVATGHTELLELDSQTVERIARKHPRVRELLESAYLQRASSPEAAAIRAVPVDPASRQRAIEVLEAYFGESRWDPRMRLRLADLLVRTGKEDDAIPLLVGLAEDLERAGYPEKAVAILKKIERIRRRNIEEVNLAPLSGKRKAADKEPGKKARRRDQARPAPVAGRRRPATQAHFESWIVDVVRDAVKPAAPEPTAPVLDREGPVYARGLRASPLFEDLGEEELLAIIREFRLLSFDPGDVILTEGEAGQSLFVLTAGSVRVHIRNAAGRNVFLTELSEGAFFGEMAVVSGKPRTATITAGDRCELLELDKASLDRVAQRFPRVRELIEDAYISRAGSAQAASIRTRTTRA